MAITSGSTALASDFVGTSSGAGDSGKVAKLDSAGKIPAPFLRAIKFGGNGSDGALTVTSGTTTISLGSAAIVLKQYTSISITGSGKVAFSNPHTGGTKLIVLVQGDATFNSSTLPTFDVSACGAAGGTAGSGTSQSGGGGTTPNFVMDASSHGGGGGPGGGGNGQSGVAFTNNYLYTTSTDRLWTRTLFLAPGAGGGGGGTRSAGGTGGVGGRGGGALYMEVAGTLTLVGTGAISVAGQTGLNATAGAGGGGGGGAGGQALVLYNIAGTITGNINDAGGGGGTGLYNNSTTGGSGGGGGGHLAAGGQGGSSAGTSGGGGGNMTNAGTSESGVGSSTPGTGGATTGGLVALNTYYS